MAHGLVRSTLEMARIGATPWRMSASAGGSRSRPPERTTTASARPGCDVAHGDHTKNTRQTAIHAATMTPMEMSTLRSTARRYPLRP